MVTHACTRYTMLNVEHLHLHVCYMELTSTVKTLYTLTTQMSAPQALNCCQHSRLSKFSFINSQSVVISSGMPETPYSKSNISASCHLLKYWTTPYSSTGILSAGLFLISLAKLVREVSPVAQWVVRPTHTLLVPGSKHDWCKNPLVFAMIAS